ncbi:MAG: Fic family protein [Candidatus Moranbacteria bacterium]|nr:Fic family protein [Candidatus Moranbacteria bacterium]
MENLTKRQNQILGLIRENKEIKTKEIKEFLEEYGEKIDRTTVIRDLDNLLEKNLIKRVGRGRSTAYRLKIENPLMTYYNPREYFSATSDRREIKERFEFNVFQYFDNSIFSKEDLQCLDNLNADYRNRMQKLSPTILKKEYERLTIELSWKSSQIEGNTYSLIETETLIKEKIEAPGHTKSEAQMILNHKRALDYILERSDNFQKLTLDKIENLHQLIVEDLGVGRNIRKGLVGITGTVYKPLDNEFQIKEALDKMISVVNNEENHPLTKSISALALISYIQPFEDGNKRTARILSNAVLLANRFCPLSYRSIDENDYKKATLLFYEQNSIFFLKELFIQQFEFSAREYFSA